MKPLDLKKFGPWAVVTGASSGIGEAFAHDLAHRGFHLVLVARRGDVLARLAAELQRVHAVQCRPVALDLAESTFMASLRKTTDAIDVGLVVSNAGTATATEFVEWDAETLERDMTVNTTAHLKLAHHFGGRLATRGRRGILLVSSIAGRQPIPYLASYTAAKSSRGHGDGTSPDPWLARAKAIPAGLTSAPVCRGALAGLASKVVSDSTNTQAVVARWDLSSVRTR